ncbi:nucleotide exchange factor GrpE [Candidatus Woesearchaeota archaeon]|nr:nucleotide exchange factor GrpE [Candidatus Woesearchaeota archaeon]
MGEQKPTKQEQTAPSIESLKKELDHKSKEATDYLDHLKRLQADFENFIKRSEKDKQAFVEFANARLIMKFLVLLDELEQGLDSLTKQNVPGEHVRGLSLIVKKFHAILSDEGVRPIESVGKHADPYLHEVMLAEQKDGVEDGIILEELQKGYRMKDKVLRYAKVKVVKNPGKSQGG